MSAEPILMPSVTLAEMEDWSFEQTVASTDGKRLVAVAVPSSGEISYRLQTRSVGSITLSCRLRCTLAVALTAYNEV